MTRSTAPTDRRTAALTRRRAMGLLGASLAWPMGARAGGLETLSGRAFGTHWRIMAPEGSGLARHRSAITALFGAVDAAFSPWRPDSALSRFNAGGGPLVTPEIVTVSDVALSLAARSGGAFDPTVGPLVARWGFGPISAGGAPDWRALAIDGGALHKRRADVTLDLCGIAKGRALDRAAQVLEAGGTGNFLFDLGGEILARGQHPDGRDWHVAVETPAGAPRPAPILRVPHGHAVATSGLGAQSYALGGTRYGHIIDPTTRHPTAGALHSVTVMASEAMAADGWATALFAAGPDAGPGLAAAEGLDALFLTHRDGVLARRTTGALARHLL